jgi:hypothetical protein
MDAELYQYIEAYVRRVVEEAFAEREDAEEFLAIPATKASCPDCGYTWHPDCPPLSHTCDRQFQAYRWATSAPNAEPVSIHTLRVGKAQLTRRYYHGRCDDLTYSDYAFLYDVGISLDKHEEDLL